MQKKQILAYYSKDEVKKEIIEYVKHRWVALYTLKGGNSGLFIRYLRGRPLKIESENEFLQLLKRFGGIVPRTIYASVNIYKKMNSVEDLDEKDNILYTTPVWDIDGSINHWREIIEAARIIVEELEKDGVTKSVYLLWSGRGIHVHINEHAFSRDLLTKFNPLDVAYSIVDYILKRSEKRIQEIAKKTVDDERPLKVENEMDLKRVFTVPLSLHKYLDYSAVCFKPNEIDSFELEWANPSKMRHNKNWREYSESEADNLAIVALKEIGGYFKRVGDVRDIVGEKTETKKAKKTPKTVKHEVKEKKIGRFPIMALVQAARYYLLTGDLEKAKSFGLNRAIFYAWAKYHGRERVIKKRPDIKVRPIATETTSVGKKIVYVGDEGSYISEKGLFTIGGKEQTPSDFDKNVVHKIEPVVPFEEAWNKTIEYLKQFPKEVLLSQQKFYKEVYVPIRDAFVEKVVKGEKKKTGTLLDFY